MGEAGHRIDGTMARPGGTDGRGTIRIARAVARFSKRRGGAATHRRRDRLGADPGRVAAVLDRDVGSVQFAPIAAVVA